MSRALLVLRPEPGASATIRRARDAGLVAHALPLFETRAIDWSEPDPDAFDALMLTSANAVRLGGAALARYRHLPVFAVGEATAAAARTAGFAKVRGKTGDAAALLAVIAETGAARVLHLAGREHRATEQAGVHVTRRVVYAAEPVAGIEGAVRDAVARGAVPLLHSPRAAARLAEIIAPSERAEAAIVAISAAVAGAAGAGWCVVRVATSPADAAMVAEAATLCDQPRLTHGL